MTLGKIVDLIILIGALCAAIYKIWDFFAKPTSKLKQKSLEKEKERIGAIIDEKMPTILYDHDLKTRDKYRADRENYLQEIKKEVLEEVGGDISKNNGTIEALKISAKDVLREKIMAVYHKNRQNRILSEYEKEALDQYYKDYKALGGNSYIDKRYNRMIKWTVIYDEEFDDEE